MPKQVEDTQRGVEEMYEGAERPPVRQNLGNIPDELDPPFYQAPEPAPVQQAEPETPDSEPEPEPERPDPNASRIEALERELAFHRAALQGAAPSQAAPPPPPQDQPIMRVTAQDAEAMGLPPQAAQYLEAAANLIYLRARQDTVAEVSSRYGALQSQQNQAQTLRQQFFTQAPDLQNYPEIVQAAATRVEAQYGDIAQRAPQLLLNEVEKQARARLAEMGIKGPTQKPRTRVRPARVESADTVRTTGTGRKMNAVQKDVADMFFEGTGIRH